MGGAGCGRRQEEVQGTALRREVTKKPTAKLTKVLDANGDLIESEFKFREIPLPMGLTDRSFDGMEKVFVTGLKPERLTRYFVARLSPEEIRPMGKGALFRRARYAPLGDASPVYDVSVFDVGGRTRVELRELPEAPAEPIPEAKLREMVKEQWLRGE